jgi:hypothetical protein
MAVDQQQLRERLQPLPYHTAMVDFLREHEPEVWRWATSASTAAEHVERVRADLLRGCYRLEEPGHPNVHAACNAAAQRLAIDVPISLYQAADGAMNAALYFIPGEVHIVFTGAVLERLHGAELQAMLGHELAHYVLWTIDRGDYHAADRILHMTAGDPRAAQSHLQSARLFGLFTEAYADRGGVVASASLDAAVAALVKIQTGLSAVSATSYLKQAQEVCAASRASSAGTTHPEIYVRVRGLELWANRETTADSWLAETLVGSLTLGALDITHQKQIEANTELLLLDFFANDRALHSESLVSHARSFIPTFDASSGRSPVQPTIPESLYEYFAYVLLDFAAGDPELDSLPLAAALLTADRWGLTSTLEKLATKELALNKKALDRAKLDAARLLAATRNVRG